MSSTSDKISGKTKRVIGDITNNKELEAKGMVEEAKGKAKSDLKRAGDKITNSAD